MMLIDKGVAVGEVITLKLTSGEEIVAKLEASLTEMQPVLAKAAVDTATLLQQVQLSYQLMTNF